MDPDLIDEDTSLRRNLAALGPDALRELQTLLEAPRPYREAVSRALVARPARTIHHDRRSASVPRPRP